MSQNRALDRTALWVVGLCLAAVVLLVEARLAAAQASMPGPPRCARRTLGRTTPPPAGGASRH